MYGVIFLSGLGLCWLLFASVQDLKKREVSNWIGFSLVVFSLGFRLFFSLFSDAGFGFLWQGLIGLGIFIALGNILYYGRMFAGGDAKLMMALGSILAFTSFFSINLKIYITFFFIFLLTGAFYGLVATFRLSFRNFKGFKKDFIKRLGKNKVLLFFGMLFGLIIIIFSFFNSLFLPFGILIFVFPYLYVYARSVDATCMVREVSIYEISEGEWLAEDIKIGNRIIKSRWDGLSSEDLKFIRKKLKRIKIKQGIPFVPVFFIAFTVLVYLWQSGLWDAFW